MSDDFKAKVIAQLSTIQSDIGSVKRELETLDDSIKTVEAQGTKLIVDRARQAEESDAKRDSEIADLESQICNARIRHREREQVRLKAYRAAFADVQKDRDEIQTAREEAVARRQELDAKWQDCIRGALGGPQEHAAPADQTGNASAASPTQVTPKSGSVFGPSLAAVPESALPAPSSPLTSLSSVHETAPTAPATPPTRATPKIVSATGSSLPTARKSASKAPSLPSASLSAVYDTVAIVPPAVPTSDDPMACNPSPPTVHASASPSTSLSSENDIIVTSSSADVTPQGPTASDPNPAPARNSPSPATSLPNTSLSSEGGLLEDELVSDAEDELVSDAEDELVSDAEDEPVNHDEHTSEQATAAPQGRRAKLMRYIDVQRVCQSDKTFYPLAVWIGGKAYWISCHKCHANDMRSPRGLQHHYMKGDCSYGRPTFGETIAMCSKDEISYPDAALIAERQDPNTKPKLRKKPRSKRISRLSRGGTNLNQVSSKPPTPSFSRWTPSKAGVWTFYQEEPYSEPGAPAPTACMMPRMRPQPKRSERGKKADEERGKDADVLMRNLSRCRDAIPSTIRRPAPTPSAREPKTGASHWNSVAGCKRIRSESPPPSVAQIEAVAREVLALGGSAVDAPDADISSPLKKRRERSGSAISSQRNGEAAQQVP